MIITDCKEAIEQGKTAKLAIAVLVVRIKREGEAYIWQRGRVYINIRDEALDTPPLTERFTIWEGEGGLVDNLGKMVRNSTEWVICDDSLEELSEVRG